MVKMVSLNSQSSHRILTAGTVSWGLTFCASQNTETVIQMFQQPTTGLLHKTRGHSLLHM